MLQTITSSPLQLTAHRLTDPSCLKSNARDCRVADAVPAEKEWLGASAETLSMAIASFGQDVSGTIEQPDLRRLCVVHISMRCFHVIPLGNVG